MKKTYDKNKEYSKHVLRCKTCMPKAKIGGAAMTMSTCVSCGVEIMNPSTAVDLACEKCSIENDKCVICGGDKNGYTYIIRDGKEVNDGKMV